MFAILSLYSIYPVLIRSDLDQIREIVREEVGNETRHVREELGYDMRVSRMEIQNDIRDLQDRIKNLEVRIARMRNVDVEEEDL